MMGKSTRELGIKKIYQWEGHENCEVDGNQVVRLGSG